MTLDDLPPGAQCFVDANIFAYLLVQTPPFSGRVTAFMDRVTRGELDAFTTSVAISEALHRIMLAEVRQLFSPPGRLLAFVQNHSEIIARLPMYLVAAQRIAGLGVHLVSVDMGDWKAAGLIASHEHLMTNDACTVAVMNRLGIEFLATNDRDFDHVSSVKPCKPL